MFLISSPKFVRRIKVQDLYKKNLFIIVTFDLRIKVFILNLSFLFDNGSSMEFLNISCTYSDRLESSE